MKTSKRLFQVTLLWNSNDASEGDFSDLVWANDGPSAILELAKRMSSLNPELATSKDRRMFEQNLIAGAGPHCAIDLHIGLSIYLNALFKGPGLVLTAKRAQALQEIFNILEYNGVTKSAQV